MLMCMSVCWRQNSGRQHDSGTTYSGLEKLNLSVATHTYTPPQVIEISNTAAKTILSHGGPTWTFQFSFFSGLLGALVRISSTNYS